MKRINFLIVTATLILNNAHAQIQKNQWLIGGAISGNYSSTAAGNPPIGFENEKKIYTLNIPIGVGYFITNKWAIGVRGNYGRKKDETTFIFNNQSFSITQTSLSESNQFAIGLFNRYYFLPNIKRFNIYGEAAYSYGKLNSISPKDAVTLQLLNVNVAPVYFMNEHVAIEFVISYANQLAIRSTNFRSNSFLFGIGLQAHLGKPKQ